MILFISDFCWSITSSCSSITLKWQKTIDTYKDFIRKSG